MGRTRVLICGAGIAGLTLAIELRRAGFEPILIEKAPGLRPQGYMMDFFGTGWDVAERIQLIDQICAIKYPIDELRFVGPDGRAYTEAPISRLRSALGGHYMCLRRQDLERLLTDHARQLAIEVRYRTSLQSLTERSAAVRATFDGGGSDDFALVIGADGVHSRVRELAFGREHEFARFLGLHVAAFHVAQDGHSLGRACNIYLERDRAAYVYPLDERRMDASFVLRNEQRAIDPDHSVAFLREHYRGAGWITEDLLRAYTGEAPMYFDAATQIVMPHWHRGRIVLVGDACGCLTLIAGQGSHYAMAGGYVLARELARRASHEDAFGAYQALLKPHVDRAQRQAVRSARYFVPSAHSRAWLRRLTIRLLFSDIGMRATMPWLGGRSVLAQYSV